MLAIERELQPPADYITTAGAIGPEHRHFLISWMIMVNILISSPACVWSLHADATSHAGGYLVISRLRTCPAHRAALKAGDLTGLSCAYPVTLP